MIRSFAHKGLEELSETGRSTKIGTDYRAKAARILDILEAATKPDDCNVPGFDFHPLKRKPRRQLQPDGEPELPDHLRLGRRSDAGPAGRLPLKGVPTMAKGTMGPRPTHPGQILGLDVLPALKLTIAEAAAELGVTRQTLYRVIRGEAAVSPEMAVRLGKFCGNGPHLWINLQARHDVWQAQRKLAATLRKIRTRRAAAAA